MANEVLKACARGLTLATEGIATSGVTQAKIDTKKVVALSDAGAALAATVNRIFTITPTAARTLATDNANSILEDLPGWTVGTWFDTTIVCLAAFNVTLVAGTGVTIVGNAVVNNASGTWRGRVDSATAVTFYRI